MNICCFVGHTPNMLPINTDTTRYRKKIGSILERHFIDNGTRIFVTGLFPGIDQWCAEQIALQISMYYDCFDPPSLWMVLSHEQQKGAERIRQITHGRNSVSSIILPHSSDQARQRFIIEQSNHMLLIHPEPATLPELSYAKTQNINPLILIPAPVAHPTKSKLQFRN